MENSNNDKIYIIKKKKIRPCIQFFCNSIQDNANMSPTEEYVGESQV